MDSTHQNKSASEKKDEPQKQETNCWGPYIEIKGVKVPLLAVLLFLVGAVVGAAAFAYFLYKKPDFIDILVESRVKATMMAQPTATLAPTYTPYPTCTPVPPTPTPINILTPTSTPTPTPTPDVIKSKMVAIRTFHNKYVTALKDQPGWNWELRAETGVVGDWERFVLLYLNNGKVVLRTYHGRFVTATNGSGCCNWVLKAEARERGVCEEFTLVELGNGRVAFETCYGKYVTAFDDSRCWMLRADTQSIGDWEQFTLVPQQ